MNIPTPYDKAVKEQNEKDAAAAAAALPPMPDAASEDDAVPHVEWWE